VIRLDFAPLEGITGHAYRRLHHEYFGGVDRYYTPFLSPNKNHCFSAKEMREILPENNSGIDVVPQLMAKNSEDFLWSAGELSAMGYREVNLNFGCPSGTVTAKGKGAGILADTMALERFLSEIYEKTPCAVSIKTRLGMERPEEFELILEIYNEFPASELIIHPRVRKDFYKNPVNIGAFERALSRAKMPVSFNGGLVTADDCKKCAEKYPQLKAIMLGQGLVSDPFLVSKVKSGTVGDAKVLQEFVEKLFSTYAEEFRDRTNAMKRMKEMWIYLIRLFGDSEQHGKKLFKAKTPDDYLTAVASIFRDLQLLENSAGGW